MIRRQTRRLQAFFLAADLFATADDAVQSFGGAGFSAEYPPEKIYRDCRINRIFEGTNEINRLLIAGTLLKRAMKGELPLMQFGQQVAKEISNPPKSESFTCPSAVSSRLPGLMSRWITPRLWA